MKKTLSIILSIIMILSVFTVSAFAAKSDSLSNSRIISSLMEDIEEYVEEAEKEAKAEEDAGEFDENIDNTNGNVTQNVNQDTITETTNPFAPTSNTEHLDTDEETGIKYVNNEIIVVVKENITEEELSSLFNYFDATIDKSIANTHIYRLIFNEELTYSELTTLINELKKSSLVIDAYLNTVAEAKAESPKIENAEDKETEQKTEESESNTESTFIYFLKNNALLLILIIGLFIALLVIRKSKGEELLPELTEFKNKVQDKFSNMGKKKK